MKITQFMKKFPNIRVATSEDGPKLIDLEKAIKVHAGGMELGYKRGEDFFEAYEQKGKFTVIFIFENTKKEMMGFAALTLKDVFLDSKIKCVGYLSDLKTHPKIPLRLRMEWRDAYQVLVNEYYKVDCLKGCDGLYSIVLDGNQRSLNALTRGKFGVEYNPISNFGSIHIAGRLIPFVPTSNKNGNFEIQKINTNNDFKPLMDFLHTQNIQKIWGEYFCGINAGEMHRRLKSWKGLELKNFLVVRNKLGEIVGSVCPWTGDYAKGHIVKKIPRKLKLFSFVMKMMGAEYKEGQLLKTLFWTHFEIKHSLSKTEKFRVFKLLLSKMYAEKQKGEYQVMSFSEFPHLEYSKLLLRYGYIYSRVPATIYEIKGQQVKSDEFPYKYKKTNECGLEIAVA